MKSYQFDSGGRNMLTVVEDNNRVLVIGEGYITVWETFADFEKQLEGEDIPSLDTFKY
jgi:hypothetical protein